MTTDQLVHEIESLPGDAKRLVIELVSQLRRRDAEEGKPQKRSKAQNPADSDFVGIWKDRDDLTDDWLRDLRRRNWREST
jgi:hypothetical protein